VKIIVYSTNTCPICVKTKTLLNDKKLTAYHDWHGYESNMGKHIGKMFGEIESLDE
jgi:glutaredoxin